MARGKDHLVAYQKRKRAEKLLSIMKDEDGITEKTVNTLLEVILKDHIAANKDLDVKQQRVFIDFLKAKAMKKMSENPLHVSIDKMDGFVEK